MWPSQNIRTLFSNHIQNRSGSGQKIEAAAENASESSIDLHRFDELMISPLRLINLPRLTTIQRAELPDLTRARQGSKIDYPLEIVLVRQDLV